MSDSKVVTLETAVTLRQNLKNLVFTNGLFDLMHAGHVAYLEAAREFGEALFVGLNSDASAFAVKGPERPIVPQEERARVLSALTCVDAVIIFDELTAGEMIKALRPEIYAKGADYVLDPDEQGTYLPETPLVHQYGGQIKLIPYQQGKSTTAIINRILERFRD